MSQPVPSAESQEARPDSSILTDVIPELRSTTATTVTPDEGRQIGEGDEVPWGLIHRVGKLYERYRQQKLSGFYEAWPSSKPPDASRNWSHFKRAAEVIWELHADPEEYIGAQWQDATASSYPYPSNLYSQRAKENWIRVINIPRAEEHLEFQKNCLAIYRERFGLTPHEVVSNLYWRTFQDWFRALFLEESQLPVIAENALNQLKNYALRQVLSEEGIDVAQLERRLRKAAKEDE